MWWAWWLGDTARSQARVDQTETEHEACVYTCVCRVGHPVCPQRSMCPHSYHVSHPRAAGHVVTLIPVCCAQEGFTRLERIQIRKMQNNKINKCLFELLSFVCKAVY